MFEKQSDNGKCPPGYEYVSGHRQDGHYVKPYCRKKSFWQRRIDKRLEKINYTINSPQFNNIMDNLDNDSDENE